MNCPPNRIRPKIDSAKEALDWIAQLQEKTWMSHEHLGQFIEALDDLVGLHALVHKET